MARSRTEQSFRHVARQIRALRNGLDKDFLPGMVRIGEEIKTDVSASRPGKGVPRDEGNLAASGLVSGKKVGRIARVAITYGGSAAPYALVQHERTDLHHTVGEARYIVRGVERWRPGGSAAIAALKENAEAAIRTASRAK